jgi:hypothetical protein
MALPKHKTCLSILRSIIGSGAGNEKTFADKIGRSTSWLKKASCGQVALTQNAAVRIGRETGVSFRWLLDNDTTKQAVDNNGNSYTIETYAHHINLIQNETLNDLEFRRDLFKVQEDQLNYVRKQLGELRESSKLLVKQLALQIEYPAHTVDEAVSKMFLMENAKKFINEML